MSEKPLPRRSPAYPLVNRILEISDRDREVLFRMIGIRESAVTFRVDCRKEVIQKNVEEAT